uniref:Esterase n=1 Tax=Oryza brachyantha TaxID=4533 RepID=J3KXT8_ORYBR
MGSSSSLLPAMAAVALHFLLLSPAAVEPRAVSTAPHRRYDAIFSFGDSFADTGNNPVAFDWYDIPDPVTRPPYGITFFDGLPTGRNCDGRLIIDFIAQNLSLPLVPPYLSHNGSFRQGANFAVGGATTLEPSFFHADDPPGTSQLFPLNTSLSVQLSWFDSLKPSLCSTPQDRSTVPRVRPRHDPTVGPGRRASALWPTILSPARLALEVYKGFFQKLIGDGATTVVVPGMIPSGCSPPILVVFADADAAEYDAATGCLREPNEIATLHNSLLLDAVEELRDKYPDVAIVHTELFDHVSEMVRSPVKFGFRKDILSVCCGGPGRYNYNTQVFCGDEGATTCKDPSKSLYWDGVHLTEAAYHYIADDWLRAIT